MTDAPSLADQVYDRLLNRIVKDEYPLNGRLPAEPALARSFGVSRPVLRTALARLREDGIVTARRGSGNYVTRRPDRRVGNLVPLGSITDIQRCYEFRVDLEGAAAGWAAQRRTDADMVAIDAAFDLLDHPHDQGMGVDADLLLHLSMARATKNPFFASVLESLSVQIQFGVQLSRSLTLMDAPERRALVQAEHRAIVEAIRARDQGAATRAMRHHITAARNRMFEGQP
ncbi:FadR/GntR family transcriptional regulator [Paracoccus sp. 1_MG-2023]|uniref:FadR/GntR family transcriptional regulator n=1 Tax=unclassified Paracoccus (in: a-proteobacteria) TaxID=2688777 RepID=UPI0026E13F0F|nr:FadR/GntR family transcriptional regulator [Paracoccus sp. 1_MG-2023]MDO6667414.1 FadR/GntR family transcriptional regulator [Paracoccus sp. 1_MG-2023]